jgi:hypothetical protein
MYSQGAAVLRHDIRGMVEEGVRQGELYIGLKALTPLPVTAKAGQYPKVTLAGAGLLKNNAKRRGPGSAYGRTVRSYTNDNYTCIEYGGEAVIPDDDARDVSRFFDLASKELMWKQREVQLAHELRTKTTLFNPATFSLTTSATAYTEANLATFDLGLDIDSAKQQIQQRGESVDSLTAIMSLSVFNRVRASTRLQNRIRGTVSTDTQLILDAQALADALGLKEVLVGKAVYDTAGEGAASASLSTIWSDTYIWLGTCNNAAGEGDYFNGSTGHTLFWAQDAAILQVEEYRDESIRSQVVRARQYTDEKIVNANTAQLLVTQYS